MLNKVPNLVYSDRTGKIYVHPYLRMCGMEGSRVRVPHPEELVSLPKGSTFYFLPGRHPIGFNPGHGGFERIERISGKPVFAASCFLVPTYIRLLLPAYWVKQGPQRRLPLWAYNAIGYYGGKFWTAAMRIDSKNRQLPHFYPCDELEKNVKRIVRLFPRNRLVQHLAYCAVHYSCLAAKNFFFGRWEAPLPASRYCNSGCLGCLSFQEEEGIASHRRIGFTPSPEELAEVALFHIERTPEAIVSFGQGCEGEPLLVHKVIGEAIGKIRRKTNKGTININTNASKPQFLKELIDSGLDSMRVSLNSAQEKFYNDYFKPKGYRFKDVLKSIRIAKQNNLFVKGTPSAEFHNSIFHPGELVVHKQRIGAFPENQLHPLLRARAIENLVFFGISTRGIVLSTSRRAFDLDYRRFVLKGACYDADAEVHRVFTGKVFPRQATVLEVDAFIAEQGEN